MCTGIKINYDGGCVLGRTMDYEVPVNYNALYLPRKYKICDDLMGEEVHSTYKVLGVCFENKDPLKDGINEHGLMGITNAFKGFNLYDSEVRRDKKNISSLDYFTYALASYKSVDELVKDLKNIHISTKNSKGEAVRTPDFHFMFSDSTKRCVVVEPKKKKLIYHDNPYDVMTNSPHFESHIRKLESVLNLNKLDSFNSCKDLPGGYDPFSRFIKAFYLTHMNDKAESSDEALSHFYNIMSAMVMPKGFVKNKTYDENTYTRYICSYDTSECLLTVKSHTNPTVYRLSFSDIEDEEKRQAFFLDKAFITKKLI